MKRYYLLLLVLCFVSRMMFPMDEPQKVREFVQVVNVEVPVRVFADGKPVDNLVKEDFILLEDKVPQDITAFYILKKKIETQGSVLAPRYFVFAFDIIDYTKDLKEAVHDVLYKIVRKQDQLLIFINNKTLFINNISDKEKALTVIERVLKEMTFEEKNKLLAYIRYFDNLIKTIVDITSWEAVTGFLEKYLVVWKEYKQRYLVPDIDAYYNFSRHLEKIDLEKWVISFYQVKIFPKLKSSEELRIRQLIGQMSGGEAEHANLARTMSRLLDEIDKETQVAQDFPVEQVSKLFYKSNATFHSIFFNTYKEMFSAEMELARVDSDIENSLREITEKTGGELITSNNIDAALGEAVEKEDICYMLTYSPRDAKKIGKIEVKPKDKNLDVFYDDNMRADYIKAYLDKKNIDVSQVKINNLSFNDKTLSLSISGFYQSKESKDFTGKLSVNIQVKNLQGIVLWNQVKDFNVTDKNVSISLPFKRLMAGRYDIVVFARDLLAGNEAVDFVQAEIE